jgi:signal transduction histidine kinase
VSSPPEIDRPIRAGFPKRVLLRPALTAATLMIPVALAGGVIIDRYEFDAWTVLTVFALIVALLAGILVSISLATDEGVLHEQLMKYATEAQAQSRLLERSERARADIVANVSHELRTPLTSIRGYADTILADLKAGRMPELGFAESIVRNASRLARLIDDLLDLSALESDQPIHREEIDVRRMTREIIEQCRPLIDARRIVVEHGCYISHLYADRLRVEQVLLNLVENACKYSPEGTRVDVRWFRLLGQTVLEVSDQGPGIPAEHLPRIFERFYRVDKGRSRAQGGTGLGLSIVKHIMTRHGGRVAVECPPQGGTIMRCFFDQ